MVPAKVLRQTPPRKPRKGPPQGPSPRKLIQRIRERRKKTGELDLFDSVLMNLPKNLDNLGDLAT